MAEGEHRSHTVAAWKHREFRFFSAARFLGVVGSEAQSVAVAWQIYQITHSALALGYTGLALFLPGILFVLVAGHVADHYDRRAIVLCCYTLQAVATALLLWLSVHGTHNVWLVYGVLFLIGIGRCFSGPAISSLLPSLVPKDDFVNAVTWNATIFQVSNAMGPMLGGFLFTVPLLSLFPGTRLGALQGASVVYCFALVCLLLYIVLFASIQARPSAEKKAFTVRTVLAGLEYVAHTRLLLGSISLDLFAVLFGGAVALLPIFAKDILHTGPYGLGLLRAMPSLGALIVSLTLVVLPVRRNAGRTMLLCVAGFAAATIVFGLSRNIWLSCVALFVTGATDMISVVVRSSILQLATPPEMRGRVSSVNWIFIGASNEFGEYESGLTAHWFGAVRAVVLGGIISMTITGLWTVFFPALRRADKLTAEDLIAVEKELSGAEPIH